MSVLAACVAWVSSGDHARIVARMLASLARRQPESSRVVGAPPFATFGFAGKVTENSNSGIGGPFYDREKGFLAVIDARIDNRRELEDTLDCSRSVTDGELVVRGYQRWGALVADRICGDFALAIWDLRQCRLYAARDPFGVKTLYFSASSDGILVSNDVEPLVGQVDRHALDPQMVLDYLTTSFGHYRRTFFRDIGRVQPGHYLLATSTSCQQVRYFRPPQEEIRLAGTADYHHEFRRLLTQSVRDRLKTHDPILAHLSGGLDSTSIVLLADEIYKGDPPGRPPLHTASAVFPGLDCDESVIIAATSARVAFPAERWVGYDAKWEHLESPTVAWPGSPAPISGGSTGDLAIAKRMGVRVILGGAGGDEVSRASGVFRDLAASGRWLTLFREVCGQVRFTQGEKWAFLKDAAIGMLPDNVLRMRQTRKPTRPGGPPDWLGPALRQIWPGDRDEWDDFGQPWLSWVQRCTWRALATATTAIPMDYRQRYGAEAGVEIRLPFLDRRLVLFVLAIPYQHRLPGGYMRRLQWNALQDRIPPEVFTASRVVSAESARILEGQNGFGRYREIFANREWLSAGFVSQKEAETMLRKAAALRLDTREERVQASRHWQAVQRIATLETWLRAVFRYSAPMEEV